LNDLENIPAFLIAAFMFVMSEPQPDVGTWLIRIAVIARILHTIVSCFDIRILLFLIFLNDLFQGLRDLSSETTS
jgi:uncharacterized MAPEG superfamily protein